MLSGLLIWAGTLTYDPSLNAFPDEADFGPIPDAYIGQQVSIDGTVTSTDPVVIRVAYDPAGSTEITLEGIDHPVQEGQHISAFGTLADPTTLTVDRALVRSPWEKWYMYAVSFLAGLWVLARSLVHWRFDRDQVAFLPRGERDA